MPGLTTLPRRFETGLLALLIVLSGCEPVAKQQPEATQFFIAENKPGVTADATISQAAYEAVAPADYSTDGLRDPFQGQEATKSALDAEAYIQRIRTGGFTMKGFLNYAGTNWALVEDAQGRAHHLATGDELIAGRVQVAEVTRQFVRIKIFDRNGRHSAEYQFHLGEM